MQITDLSNNQIDRVQDAVRANASNIRTIRINAILAGFTLKCLPTVADVAVEGRIDGVGSYVDLETTGILLDPFADTTQDFQIRYTAGNIYGGNPVSNTNPLQSRLFDLELARS